MMALGWPPTPVDLSPGRIAHMGGRKGPLQQLGTRLVSGGVPVPVVWTSNMHPHPGGLAPTYMSSGRRRDASL